MRSPTEAIRSWHRRLVSARGSVCARFNDEELSVIDRLVSEGIGTSREDVVRQAVGWYDDALRRHRVGKAIEDHYLRHPQTEADHAQAMANAIALTEAESW